MNVFITKAIEIIQIKIKKKHRNQEVAAATPGIQYTRQTNTVLQFLSLSFTKYLKQASLY